MFGRKRIAVLITTQGALILLLALAVFGWGLHAKLAQYDTSPNSISTHAKLSSEERSANLLAVVPVQLVPADGVAAFPSRSFTERVQSASIRLVRFDDVAVQLRVAARSMLSGPGMMLRPPPSLS